MKWLASESGRERLIEMLRGIDKRREGKYDWRRRADERAPPGWRTKPSPVTPREYEPAPRSYEYTYKETLRDHALTRLRGGKESEEWVKANFWRSEATKKEAHAVLLSKLSVEFKILLNRRDNRRVLMTVPPLKQGKHRMGRPNTEKMNNFMTSLLSGRLALLHATTKDRPIVEDLREIVLNYFCGMRRVCNDERCFLTQEQITYCLSQSRDELLPLGGQADDSDDESEDEVNMSLPTAGYRAVGFVGFT